MDIPIKKLLLSRRNCILSTPIYDKLQKYAHSSQYPFHMPGHKGGRGQKLKNPLSYDITEIPGFDNLHQPQGIIQEAQKLCADVFGAKESFFMVNGASGGILAAILSVCKEGDKLLLARNSHRCAYHGLVLCGGEPIYLQPQYTKYGICGGILPQDVEKALSQQEDIKAVLITSPTYEGFVSDVEKIARAVHKRKIPLIVDEAHGAHMKFHTYFPKTALECGADIVVQSFHKTLPAMTQTAVLHIQGSYIEREKLSQTLAMVQSSSPSYVFLASMDLCREFCQTGFAQFEQYTHFLKKLRKQLKELNHFTLLGKELCQHYGIYDIDQGKLVFSSRISGHWLEKKLLKDYGLQIEMSSFYHAIAMTSVADKKKAFQKFWRAMKTVDRTVFNYSSQIDFLEKPLTPIIEYKPREAFFAKTYQTEFKNCEGKVCGEFIIPYPPGIPLVVPGERITRCILDTIEQGVQKGTHFIGMADSTLKNIQTI